MSTEMSSPAGARRAAGASRGAGAGARADAAYESPGRWFGLLRVAFDQAMAAVEAELGSRYPELRPAHLQLFRFGGIDGLHTSELAAHAGITKQSMHELVTHLERHGYLTRTPDPADSRARRVRLTAKGRRLEKDLVRAIDVVRDDWRSRLGEQRLTALWSILQELTGEVTPEGRPV